MKPVWGGEEDGDATWDEDNDGDGEEEEEISMGRRKDRSWCKFRIRG